MLISVHTSYIFVPGTWYLVPLCQSRNHCAAGCVPSPWLKASHLIARTGHDWTASPWWEAPGPRPSIASRLLLRSSGGTTQVQLVGRIWGFEAPWLTVDLQEPKSKSHQHRFASAGNLVSCWAISRHSSLLCCLHTCFVLPGYLNGPFTWSKTNVGVESTSIVYECGHRCYNMSPWEAFFFPRVREDHNSFFPTESEEFCRCVPAKGKTRLIAKFCESICMDNNTCIFGAGWSFRGERIKISTKNTSIYLVALSLPELDQLDRFIY